MLFLKCLPTDQNGALFFLHWHECKLFYKSLVAKLSLSRYDDGQHPRERFHLLLKLQAQQASPYRGYSVQMRKRLENVIKVVNRQPLRLG